MHKEFRIHQITFIEVFPIELKDVGLQVHFHWIHNHQVKHNSNIGEIL